MNPKSPLILAAGTVLCTLVSTAAAFPQTIDSFRPGGLFGQSRPASERSHNLDVAVSLIEAHDSDTPVEFVALDPAAMLPTGYSTMLMANGSYRWQRQRVQIGASGASTVRYFNQVDEIRSISHTVGLGMNARTSARTHFAVNGAASYSPAYLYGLFPEQRLSEPGQAIVTAPDFLTRDTESYSYGTTATVTYALSARNSLAVAGDFNYTDFTHEDETQRDMTSGALRTGYSRNLTRNTVLNTGYRYRNGTFQFNAPAESDLADVRTNEHGVDVGVRYERPLSPTRRFVVDVNIGSSRLEGPLMFEEDSIRGRVYRAATNASVAYQFFRTWEVRSVYRRGVEYVAELTGPVFTDGATLGVSGYWSSRVDVFASARYARGESALDRNALSFDTYSGNVRVRYALSRSVAAHAEYLYYYYDFRGDLQHLPPSVPGTERNGIRAGLSVRFSAR